MLTCLSIATYVAKLPLSFQYVPPHLAGARQRPLPFPRTAPAAPAATQDPRCAQEVTPLRLRHTACPCQLCSTHHILLGIGLEARGTPLLQHSHKVALAPMPQQKHALPQLNQGFPATRLATRYVCALGSWPCPVHHRAYFTCCAGPGLGASSTGGQQVSFCSCMQPCNA